MKNKKIIIAIVAVVLIALGIFFVTKKENVVNVVDGTTQNVKEIASSYFTKHNINDITELYEVVDATNTTYSTKSMLSTNDLADKLVVTLKSEDREYTLELYASKDVIDSSIIEDNTNYEYELVNISRVNVDYFEAEEGFNYVFKTQIDENIFGKMNIDEFKEPESSKLYIFMQRFNELFKKVEASE